MFIKKIMNALLLHLIILFWDKLKNLMIIDVLFKTVMMF